MEIYGNTYSVYSPAIALMEQDDADLIEEAFNYWINVSAVCFESKILFDLINN